MGLVGAIMTFHSAAECLSSDVTESYAAYYLGTRDTRRHAPIHLASFIAPACLPFPSLSHASMLIIENNYAFSVQLIHENIYWEIKS